MSSTPRSNNHRSPYGPNNPHPLSKLKTELVWDGKYDEWGNRREVDFAGSAMPLQKIETIDQPRSEAAAAGQLELFEKKTKRLDDFRNMLIWGDNKLVIASLLKDFKGRVHGRKGPAVIHVDGIDSIFTRDEAKALVRAAKEAGAKETTCLAWEFEMDLRLVCNSLEREFDIGIKLIQIPREIMEKNRKEPPPFLEVATLTAQPVYNIIDGKKVVDIKLTSFIPSLAEVPTKELEALQERAVKSGFDFIDFWAIDFDYSNGGPFNHHWQDYRTRRDRSLKTVSDQRYTYPRKGRHAACVKVVDIFGCDTSITVEVDDA